MLTEARLAQLSMNSGLAHIMEYEEIKDLVDELISLRKSSLPKLRKAVAMAAEIGHVEKKFGKIEVNNYDDHILDFRPDKVVAHLAYAWASKPLEKYSLEICEDGVNVNIDEFVAGVTKVQPYTEGLLQACNLFVKEHSKNEGSVHGQD